jgi:hypothetical protein
VVISIIALLISLLLPALGKGRERARYLKWQAYSQGLRAIPEHSLYYNFQTGQGGAKIENMAAGDPLIQAREDVEPRDGDGTLRTVAATTHPAPAGLWSSASISDRWLGKPNVKLNGVNEFAEAKTSRLIDEKYHDDAITIMMSLKVQLPTGSSYARPISMQGGTNFWELQQDGSPTDIDVRIRIDTDGSGGNFNQVRGRAPAFDEKWRQPVFTLNRGQYRCYVDGLISSGADGSGTYGHDDGFSNANALTLGSRGGSSDFFSGRIDEVSIWRTDLSADSIKTWGLVGAVRARN